jgi:hypothetical protein
VRGDAEEDGVEQVVVKHVKQHGGGEVRQDEVEHHG